MKNVNLTILEEKQNPLLHRKEISFEVNHEKSPTPRKAEIKTKIAATYTADPDLIQIISMKIKTNAWKTVGTAHIYSSLEDAKRIIPKHLLQREAPKVKPEKPSKKRK